MIDLSPPAKIARVPFLAPRSPPETGASMAEQFLEAAAADISTAREGSEVVISTTIPPGWRPWRAPEERSRRTERTSEGKPTMEKTTSDCEARARGESAKWAPMSRRGWALERVRLKTVTVYPALMRCAHMDRPITPVPIQPRRVFDGVIGSVAAVAAAMERGRNSVMVKKVLRSVWGLAG